MFLICLPLFGESPGIMLFICLPLFEESPEASSLSMTALLTKIEIKPMLSWMLEECQFKLEWLSFCVAQAYMVRLGMAGFATMDDLIADLKK